MTITGVLTGIFIASDPDSFVSERVRCIEVLENGFQGDKHTGWFRKADARAKRYAEGTEIWNSRQISIVSEEELALIARDLNVPRVRPEWLGANLCVRLVPDLSLLPPRTKIFIPNEAGKLFNEVVSEVGLYITASNKPCIGPGRIIQSHYPDIPDLDVQFSRMAMNRRGLVAVVEHTGLIEEGSVISVVIQ